GISPAKIIFKTILRGRRKILLVDPARYAVVYLSRPITSRRGCTWCSSLRGSPARAGRPRVLVRRFSSLLAAAWGLTGCGWPVGGEACCAPTRDATESTRAATSVRRDDTRTARGQAGMVRWMVRGLVHGSRCPMHPVHVAAFAHVPRHTHGTPAREPLGKAGVF